MDVALYSYLINEKRKESKKKTKRNREKENEKKIRNIVANLQCQQIRGEFLLGPPLPNPGSTRDFTLLAYALNQYTFNIIYIYMCVCVPVYCYYSLCIDLTLLNISVRKQQTARFIYHAIAICVPATNIHLKWHIYLTCTNYLMFTNGRIYMPHT